MTPDDLIEEGFFFYFPLYTVGIADPGQQQHHVFDPNEHCDIQPLSSKHGPCVGLFTDEDLASRAVEHLATLREIRGCYPMRIDSPEHLTTILKFLQSKGVKHVGTDNHVGENPYGFYRTIEECIHASEHPEQVGDND
jgi:hypothetical protein